MPQFPSSHGARKNLAQPEGSGNPSNSMLNSDRSPHLLQGANSAITDQQLVDNSNLSRTMLQCHRSTAIRHAICINRGAGDSCLDFPMMDANTDGPRFNVLIATHQKKLGKSSITCDCWPSRRGYMTRMFKKPELSSAKLVKLREYTLSWDLVIRRSKISPPNSTGVASSVPTASMIW
ncbi:hypothetical protein OG21DRAFT_1519157 [Imleria badia]|nr:hypothetical protein OG21DRAFT_1519157 [Imleria badia]